MASEKTLALRAVQPKQYRAGDERGRASSPVFREALAQGQGLRSANRAARLAADKQALTRAQRKDLERARRLYKRTGTLGPKPTWLLEIERQAAKVDVSEVAAAISQEGEEL